MINWLNPRTLSIKIWGISTYRDQLEIYFIDFLYIPNAEYILLLTAFTKSNMCYFTKKHECKSMNKYVKTFKVFILKVTKQHCKITKLLLISNTQILFSLFEVNFFSSQVWLTDNERQKVEELPRVSLQLLNWARANIFFERNTFYS